MSSRIIAPAALALGATLLLGGCSLAPSYERPAVAQPQTFRELPAGWKSAEPADDQPRGAWWTHFGDPALDALEARLARANQNLQAALARLDQARAAAGIARAPLWPALNATAAGTRSRVSQTTSRYAAGTPPISKDDQLAATLSYELDVWGRVRNGAQAGDARAEASSADLETLRLSLHAELASDYFALRGHEHLQQALGEALDSYTQALTLTRHRYEGGLVSEADVNQARVQLENARTALADSQLKRAQLLHAIAVLVGEAAPDFALPAAQLPAAPPVIPAGVPSTLLERRPDVAAAERRAYAANADIGVARAAYFPTFTIGAAAGFESSRRSSWFDAPSRFWSLGPQAVLSLVDGGRIGDNVDLAHAAFDEAAANYRQVVLTAYKEAEDALAAIRLLDAELASQQAAEEAASRVLRQVRQQYEGGLVSYLAVASAQSAALSARQAVINLRVARLNASVQLLKALGGGWEPLRPSAAR